MEFDAKSASCVLSTGRVLRDVIRAAGFMIDSDGQLLLYGKYGETQAYGYDESDPAPLTPEERREIAAHMIELWREWGGVSHALVIGEKMRFSVELIEAIAERPDHQSEIVIVQNIERGPDGCVTVWLKPEDSGR